MQSSPLYSTVAAKEECSDHADGSTDHERVCRICLEDDLPNEMIAPCSCKGSSKWVHRICLDHWRATNPDSIAFSKCTECLTNYRMEATAARAHGKRIKYCLYVSHDIGFATLLVQLVIAIPGLIVWLIDRENGALTLTCKTNWCRFGTYYACGLFLVLVGLGFYGLLLLCCNSCSVSKAMEVMLEVPENHDTDIQVNMNAPAVVVAAMVPPMNEMGERSVVTKETPEIHPQPTSIHRHPARREYHDGYYYYYCPNYSYYGGNGNACYCPGCDGDCTCDCCHGCEIGDNSNDGLPVIVVILAVVAIILAVIGLFVGVFIAVVVIQRILERHMWVLQKRRLVREFRVMDLSKNFHNTHDVEFCFQELVVPSAPELPVEDVTYLKKIGLME